MITYVTPGHPVRAGAGYDCCCGECVHRRALLLAALEDAAAYREGRGGAECGHCDAHPAGICDDHGDDLAKATDYRALAREFGGAS